MWNFRKDRPMNRLKSLIACAALAVVAHPLDWGNAQDVGLTPPDIAEFQEVAETAYLYGFPMLVA